MNADMWMVLVSAVLAIVILRKEYKSMQSYDYRIKRKWEELKELENRRRGI